MKYKCWPLPLLLCILLAEYPAVVVGDAGSDYLASKEQEVEQMANQSLANYNQRCGTFSIGYATLDSCQLLTINFTCRNHDESCAQ